MRARPAGPAESSALHDFARSGPTKEAHRRALNRSGGLQRSGAGQGHGRCLPVTLPRGASDQRKRAEAGNPRSPTPRGTHQGERSGDLYGDRSGEVEGPRNHWKRSGEPFGRHPSAPPLDIPHRPRRGVCSSRDTVNAAVMGPLSGEQGCVLQGSLGVVLCRGCPDRRGSSVAVPVLIRRRHPPWSV